MASIRVAWKCFSFYYIYSLNRVDIYVKKSNKKFSSEEVALTGLMSAIIFASTCVHIDVPLGTKSAMIHLGNALCLVSGMILSPVLAGLSSGVGSLIFDLIHPVYSSSALFTFISKFFLAFFCGVILKKIKGNFKNITCNIIAGIISLIFFIILRSVKVYVNNIFLLNLGQEASLILLIKNIFISFVNGILAIIISVPLSEIIKKILKKNEIIF